MRWRWLFILGAMLRAASAAPGGDAPAPAWRPEGVRLTASASPTRVTVGDRIYYALAISVPEGMTVSPPATGTQAGDFRIRELGRKSVADAKGKREEVSLLYDLRAYGTGEKQIPPFRAVVRNREGQTAEVDGGAIAVVVESVLDKEPKDIRDIKPPLPMPYFPVKLVAVLAAAVCAAAAAAALLRRFRKRTAESALPLRPPHEVAHDELRRLKAMNLPLSGRVKEYYIRLSGIARRYIEARFGLRAPDRTTEEFLAEAGGSGLLDARARTLVGDFLEQCDMVKFARYGPAVEEMERAFDAAARFVDETTPPAIEAGHGGGTS
ncbi:MAG: hypothetical protein WCP22_09970 [Chlamydiota bacterium]